MLSRMLPILSLGPARLALLPGLVSARNYYEGLIDAMVPKS